MQDAKNTLERGLTNFGIVVESGVSSAELQSVDSERDFIVGRWLTVPKVIRAKASRPIAVELLNSLEGAEPERLPKPAELLSALEGGLPKVAELLDSLPGVGRGCLEKAALDFTRKYGPLEFPYCAGEPFQFSVRDWGVSVRQLQDMWTWISKCSRKGIPLSIGDGPFSARLRFINGRITFVTDFLPAFVALEMASVPAPLLCVCANRGKGCKSPYFIASDKREKYCSESCAQAAQRRVKLEWWNKNRRGK
jgi:hypothetical protein